MGLPELIPVQGSQSADGRSRKPAVVCHCFQPSPRLPSQPQNVTAPWPVPNCTAWYECERFAQGSCLKARWLGSPADRKSSDLTKPLRYRRRVTLR